MKRISMSLDDWVIDEIIGESNNRSARIQELIIKGHYSKISKKDIKALIEKKESVSNGISHA